MNLQPSDGAVLLPVDHGERRRIRARQYEEWQERLRAFNAWKETPEGKAAVAERKALEHDILLRHFASFLGSRGVASDASNIDMLYEVFCLGTGSYSEDWTDGADHEINALPPLGPSL